MSFRARNKNPIIVTGDSAIEIVPGRIAIVQHDLDENGNTITVQGATLEEAIAKLREMEQLP